MELFLADIERRIKVHLMRNEALWKRAGATKWNAVFTPFSPTTLEYFLYFEKKAVKLLSLPRLSLPRHTVTVPPPPSTQPASVAGSAQAGPQLAANRCRAPLP